MRETVILLAGADSLFETGGIGMFGFRIRIDQLNIYVGNLSFKLSEDELRTAFEEHGQVSSASIIKDRETGRSRGFGFVEMPNNEEGQKAIDALNGEPLDGRNLTVNEARPKPDRDRDRGRRY